MHDQNDMKGGELSFSIFPVFLQVLSTKAWAHFDLNKHDLQRHSDFSTQELSLIMTDSECIIWSLLRAQSQDQH